MKHRIVYAEVFDTKDLRSLPRTVLRRIKKAIEQKLTSMPHVFGKPLSQSLRGFWSLRVGDYRVIYRIRKHAVDIYMIRHRSVVYEELAKKTTFFRLH